MWYRLVTESEAAHGHMLKEQTESCLSVRSFNWALKVVEANYNG